MEYVRRFDDSLNAIRLVFAYGEGGQPEHGGMEGKQETYQEHAMSKPYPTSETSFMRPSAIPSAPEPSVRVDT
ncbi:hypothetical protein K466DRAFT_580396 [Polyporus arcularius HHB13444]|uniref:Uncharacterized protein n=1 Tax=Polyporus arcularius HHB13444 TaxID=1314778 RepID=A0A5C3PX22_9APHY|nr:hypothetical protein K466DRAFT_580396 [Polyporus arcularius HHB13444]